MRALIWLATVSVLIYLAACAALYFFQSALIYFPTPAASFSARNQMELAVDGARLQITTRSSSGASAIIYFGGNAEDVSASLPDLARAFPESALYLMNYRGYGGSTGSPAESVLQKDALALFDRVHARHTEVVVIGRSLGSGIAVQVAAQRPVARLVLVTPYDSFYELARRQFPFFPVGWLLTERYESTRYAPLVRAPTTLIAAERDEIIPRSNTDRLHAAFSQRVAKFIVLPNTSHNTISGHSLYPEALRGNL